MKEWIRYGYCEHGKPEVVYTNYNNTPIKYIFDICKIHRTRECSKGKEYHGIERTGNSN